MTRTFRATMGEAAFEVEVDVGVGGGVGVGVDGSGAPGTAGTVARFVVSRPSSDEPESVRVAPAPASPPVTGSSGTASRGAIADASDDARGRARGRTRDAALDGVSGRAVDDVVATRALVVPDGMTTWVFVEGEVWTVEVEPGGRAARRPRAAADADGLMAPMPATVIRVLVEPGREVRRGETLLLLEAMKMELPVRAPRDGRVTALHCAPGQLVQPGVPLVELA